jgi:hypothetical protein
MMVVQWQLERNGRILDLEENWKDGSLMEV